MTPIQSKWIASLVRDGETVTLQTVNGKKLQYTGVPEHITKALMVANSPGKIWRELLRGKYGEKSL